MTIETIIAMIVQTVILVAGGFVYLQKREDELMKKISETKRDIDLMKGNYLDRFDELKDIMSDRTRAIEEIRINLKTLMRAQGLTYETGGTK